MGIETSCDETAVAIVSSERAILSNHVSSQIEIHKPYGGIVPELAARDHLRMIDYVVRMALSDAGISKEDIGAVAVTCGPGLMGGIIVGVAYAKALCSSMNIPFIAVNHLAAHALTVRLTHRTNFPYCLLLISGGHCQLLLVRDINEYSLFGSTLDDSLGECFDKVARILGLPYPGGPHIEEKARIGNSLAFRFPCPLLSCRDPKYKCSFSFSGLKTSVIQMVRKQELSDILVSDFCASFQKSVAEILVDRSSNALKLCRDAGISISSFAVAGGVASNIFIRSSLKNLSEEKFNLIFTAPPINLCTDNAAMVAWVGIEKLVRGQSDHLDFIPHHRWPLTQDRSY